MNVGEHQWIRQKCYASFGDARKVTPKEATQIQLLIAQRQIQQHYPMQPAVVQKIVAAGLKSKALATELKAML